MSGNPLLPFWVVSYLLSIRAVGLFRHISAPVRITPMKEKAKQKVPDFNYTWKEDVGGKALYRFASIIRQSKIHIVGY